MATSGTATFNLTRNEIIRLAMLKCNAIDPRESVNVQEQADASLFLNLIVKRLSAHQPLFGVIDHTIPLYDGKQYYTVGPSGNKNVNKPMGVNQARIEYASGSEIEIDLVSRSEYMSLPAKDSTGSVTMCAWDKQLAQGRLYVWPVATTSSTSLSDGATDYFTDSPAVTGEYYYTGTAITSEPTYVFAGGTELTNGTIGSLSNGQYAWGDNDALGANTLYVKTSLGDPDGQASGYIKVLTSTPDKIIISAQRPLEDFSSSSDNPDFPQESVSMLVSSLAAELSPQYSPGLTQYLMAEATQQEQEYFGMDNDDRSLKIRPRRS